MDNFVLGLLFCHCSMVVLFTATFTDYLDISRVLEQKFLNVRQTAQENRSLNPKRRMVKETTYIYILVQSRVMSLSTFLKCDFSIMII